MEHMDRATGTIICHGCGCVKSELFFDHFAKPNGADGLKNKTWVAHAYPVQSGNRREYLHAEIIKQWTGTSPRIPDIDWALIEEELCKGDVPLSDLCNSDVFSALSRIEKDPEHVVEKTRWAYYNKPFRKRKFGVYRERALQIRGRIGSRFLGGGYCAGCQPPSPELLEASGTAYMYIQGRFSKHRHGEDCPGVHIKNCHTVASCRKLFPSRQCLSWVLEYLRDKHIDVEIREEAEKALAYFPRQRAYADLWMMFSTIWSEGHTDGHDGLESWRLVGEVEENWEGWEGWEEGWEGVPAPWCSNIVA